MQIHCPSNTNHKKFLIPLWVRATFKFSDDGSIAILHVKPLESLEEKLADQNRYPTLSCKECGTDAKAVFNEYEKLTDETRELKALEGL
jgi:hypothetical protein